MTVLEEDYDALSRQLAGAVWALNEALGALVLDDDRKEAIARIEYGLRQAGVDPSRPLRGQ